MSNEKKQKISRATMTRFPVYLKALRVMGHGSLIIMIRTIPSITTHTPLVHYLRKDFMHVIKKNLNTSQRIMKHSFQSQVRWI